MVNSVSPSPPPPSPFPVPPSYPQATREILRCPPPRREDKGGQSFRIWVALAHKFEERGGNSSPLVLEERDKGVRRLKGSASGTIHWKRPYSFLFRVRLALSDAPIRDSGDIASDFLTEPPPRWPKLQLRHFCSGTSPPSPNPENSSALDEPFKKTPSLRTDRMCCPSNTGHITDIGRHCGIKVVEKSSREEDLTRSREYAGTLEFYGGNLEPKYATTSLAEFSQICRPGIRTATSVVGDLTNPIGITVNLKSSLNFPKLNQKSSIPGKPMWSH
ncbi:hypothetical protein B0H13DRAFT_1931377 [Mycena leptocephala]|nr:hypothetical protein B0H13DRAFT_1931377 [Mycena leptocephala]